jgi:hypothetical protein
MRFDATLLIGVSEFFKGFMGENTLMLALMGR